MYARSSGLSTSGALFLWSFSEGGVETFSLPQTYLSLPAAPPHLPTETPRGVSGPQGPSRRESFLAGVGLVFIPWEQPVVPRPASPSPVVLVGFALLASPTQLHAQTSLRGY